MSTQQLDLPLTEREVELLVIGAGQAGLATAAAAQQEGLQVLVVDAADGPGGSWGRYYESLTLFSPARFSALPGMVLPGDPDRYPARDEITDYLRAYAARFEVPIRTSTRITDLTWDGSAFTVAVAGGDQLRARAVVAATGGFGRPVIPDLPGADGFTGHLLHSSVYRAPQDFAGQRVVVVGAGNSAVQIAVEVAQVATVSLATRSTVRFTPQAPLGIDIHHWLRWSGLEALPLGPKAASVVSVLDRGPYAAALTAGRPDRRPMFTHFTTEGVTWPGGVRERVDVVILATGYRPDVGYLAGLGALDPTGWPVHCRGMSLTTPRLGYVGLPGQTGFASATIRGVGADARRVVRRLTRDLAAATPRPTTCRLPTLANR